MQLGRVLASSFVQKLVTATHSGPHLVGVKTKAQGTGATCPKSGGRGAGRQDPREAPDGRPAATPLSRVKVEKPDVPSAPRGAGGSRTISY